MTFDTGPLTSITRLITFSIKHESSLTTMSIRRSSRLLTTLTSSSPTPPSLVPPYSHSQAIPEEPSPSLRPPYAHSSTTKPGEKDSNGKVVQPKLKYALLERSAEAMKREKEEAYLAWAAGLGEETIQRVWEETLTALSQVHGTGVSLLSQFI